MSRAALITLLALLALGANFLWSSRGDVWEVTAGPSATPAARRWGGQDLPTLEQFDPGQAVDRTIPKRQKHPKLSSHLSRAIGAQITAVSIAPFTSEDRTSGLGAALEARPARTDGEGRVQVYVIAATTVGAASRDISVAGGEIERSLAERGIIQAWIPVAALNQLADQPSIKNIRLPDYGVPDAGLKLTEGDSIHKASLARTVFALDGTGVRVGVISDGVGGLSSSQSGSDLGNVNTATCNVAPTDPGTTGAEGTAMLEIIHDLAPGAELWFGHQEGGTGLDFLAAIDCLAANTEVIADDISFFNAGPYDGTSIISSHITSALNNPANRLRVYSHSVGNRADEHYQETYSKCGPVDLHRFSATARTIDSLPFGPRCDNPMIVDPQAELSVYLQWNDPFDASCNDYDLHIFAHNASTLLAESIDPQTCSQNPTELLVWQNTLATPVIVDLVISNPNGDAAPREFDLFTINAHPNFLTPGNSVPNGGDAGGRVISVGSINASDPGNDTIASYSSLGPTNDGRTKPDIVGIDCVAVTGAGGFPPTFCGTSAAAPHIAGIAALLLECRSSLKAGESGDNPDGDRSALRNALLSGAEDLGLPGMDNTFGAGRADVLASANALCDSPTPSATPTATATGSATPTPSGTPGAALAGDIDCSATIDAVDALKLLRSVAGLPIGLPPGCLYTGDLDCSGVGDAIDALKLLRYVAGLSSFIPSGCRPIGT